MKFPEVPYAPGGLLNGLRITIGTDAEIDSLLRELATIV
jgi:histidinol-phosphate/aromatic aminotransferase/cobyric acid decarboxylase-like protein